MRALAWLAVMAVGGLAPACDESNDGRTPGGEDPGAAACVGSKCDTPDGTPAEEACRDRRDEAFVYGREAMTADAIRWSCRDVAGVTEGDRGQEYCEYWAIADLGNGPVQYGEPLGDRKESDPELRLTYDEIDELDRLPTDEVIGACVFTSWNHDRDASCSDCGDIAGIPVTNSFQATHVVNSFGAAKDLVVSCLEGEQDASIEDPYTRGCFYADEHFSTGWRKSDASICAAAVALQECGCTVDGGADAIALPQDLGFPLGSWKRENDLPPGCRNVPVDDDGSQVLVECDLTRAQVIEGRDDLKQLCREEYADDVVVHVPMDRVDIECEDRCGETPWALSG